MPAKTVRTCLSLCGDDECGHEFCWVDMRVCAGCGRGPLNDNEASCGECALAVVETCKVCGAPCAEGFDCDNDHDL